ncbi:protein kinase [bacterium]|nr:protein kinase [bacterium]
MAELHFCPRCKKQKTGGVGGFVTQFIDICTCDTAPPSQEETMVVCARCAKRIPSRPGSITQWVFKEGSCACDRPQPVKKSIDSFVQPTFEGFRENREEEELSLDAEQFPMDRYKAVAVLGKGAAGTVYLCRDRLLGKKVAVKTLLNLSADQLVDFQEEARATARLSHPNIVTILDFGATESGVPFMVMDYVPGISLEAHIKAHGPLKEETTRKIFYRLSLALGYAHNQGIYHRDIKPSNIILFEAETGIDLCLIDFGIAKVKEVSGLITIYQKKTLAGTPRYMAPDTVRGLDYDQRSEVYSLGCVLFESLTGFPPFQGETAMEIISNHASQPVPTLGTYLEDPDTESETELDWIVYKCLAKDKEERFQSMEELGSALQGATIYDASHSKMEIASNEKTNKTSPTKLVTTVALALLLVGSAAAYLLLHNDSKMPTASKAVKKEPITNNNSKKTKNADQDVSYFIASAGEEKPYLVHREKGKYLVQGLVKRNKESLKFLINNKNIENLEFSQDDLGGDTLAYLASLPSLKGLTISYCDIDKDTLALVGSLSKLKRLNIVNSPVNDSDYGALTGLSNVRELYLWGVPGKEEILRNVSTLKTIEFLGLRDCRYLCDNGIELLTTLPNLHALQLVGTPIKGKNITSLKKLSRLRGLELTEFNEDLVEGMKDMNLISLSIAHNQDITDKDLMAATKIKSLKFLHVKECKKISPAFKKYFGSIAGNVKVLMEGSELIAPISLEQ